MTNCPNCGAPYKLGIPVCEYCGTPREEANDDNIRDTGNSQNRIAVNAWNGAIVFMGAVNGVKDIQATYKTVTPDPSQQAACGAQALANAASNNTCSFEQMRLNAMQAQVNAAQCEQTFRLMCNAFPHVEPPPEIERKKRFAPAMPLLFAVNVFWFLILTAFVALSGLLCALYGAGFFPKAALIGLISAGYTVNLRALIRAYKGD